MNCFTNSKLTEFTRISHNKTSPRNHSIDTITIHCVVGQLTVETLGEIFYPESFKASCNYGIGADGRVGLFVGECDRSWCSSSSSNDNRAVTIEVACDRTTPYKVNDVVYTSLINLVTDICQRNGIKKLLWEGDKSLIGQMNRQNMTVHRWFANKECPGEYLYNLHPDIVKRVNKNLGGVTMTKDEAKTIVQSKTGFSNETITYIADSYRYGDEAIIKLAELLK